MKRVSLLFLLVMSCILAMANNRATLNYDFESVVDPNARTMEGRHASAIVTPTVSHSSAIAEYTPNRGNVTVILTTDDVWSDGSGYQMLLDADATAYGSIIPETGPLTSSGDASAATYAEFEYKIPTNADGSLSTTNIVLNTSVSIEIPAGTYDWCITNPTPGDRMWIASGNGTIGGRADDYTFQEGLIYEFHVYFGGQNDATDLTITDPNVPIITATPSPLVGGYITIETSTRDEQTYSFEGDTEGWTTIDADGDGYDWALGSILMSGYTIPAYSGEDCMSSQSYDATAGALTPDNYLVSPQVTLGGYITFYACAQDPSYASEHFGVAVSTTNNTNASAFTTIQEWTMTAKSAGQVGNYASKSREGREGTWYEYTVDLSAYSGTGYVAIRHFDCSDWFYLNVDDITISDNPPAPTGETVSEVIEAGMTCILTAIPFEGYHFVNWTENGSVVSTEAVYSFTVESSRTLVANFSDQLLVTATATPTEGGTVTMSNAVIFADGFEEGLGNWNVLTVNSDGGTWLHSDNNSGGYDYTTLAHSGTCFAMCYS